MTRQGRARLVDLAEFRENGRGALSVATCGPQVPFITRRTFLIYDVPAGTSRGGHAHRQCEQFVICPAGAAALVTKDATGTASFCLNKPNQGLYLPSLTWLSIMPATEATVILVLASDPYDDADYIREQAEFEALIADIRP